MNASRSAHHESLSQKYGPTAKLFLITAIVLFFATIVSGLTGYAGDVAVDLYNYHALHKGPIGGVGFFAVLDPFFFAFFAVIYGAYWKFASKKLSGRLTMVHFLVSVIFAAAVIHFSRQRVDLYNPEWISSNNWPPFYPTQSRIFATSRWVCAVGQLAFVANLAFGFFRDTEDANLRPI